MIEPERLPDWLAPLARTAVDLPREQLSQFTPPEQGGRDSAVLIAFGETHAGPSVLLIERAASLRTHAGQAAFPGGASEAGDADPIATALREANEEVGLDPDEAAVFARLPALFLPPSGFVVTPVLAWWRGARPMYKLDPREVARAELVPIAELVEPANRFRVRHPSGFAGAGFQAGGLFVWGFTAGLLDRLLELAGWARPWDQAVIRPLPGSGGPAAAGTVPA